MRNRLRLAIAEVAKTSGRYCSGFSQERSTGEGELSVDITFESMDDFSPAAVARKVDALNKLLQARQQLSNLLSYMDGKSGAEELLSRAVKDPALLQALAAAPKPDEPASATKE